MRLKKAQTALFLLFCFGLIACGKKGDPFVPVKEPLNHVTDLEGMWDGESIVLTGRIQGAMKEGTIIRAYYAMYPPDQIPCEGCPIEYEGFQPFGREVVSENRFLCRIREIKPGNIYFFEIKVIGSGGGQGPPSKRVRVEVPAFR
ncbi:MAG: hypothetical protein JW836_00340 [Deltaproteobacteria bacterium]|nr:hypothetical protein [Deltaproteobacteria bacterium]